MLLKSGFSGLLTSNGIGTTEIGPPPQAPQHGQHHQQQQQEHQPQSVIGGSVTTFKSPPQPVSILSNGSPTPLRMNNNNSHNGGDHQQPQQQFGGNGDPGATSNSNNNSFRINNFQKNGSSTLYAIANRNANGGAGGMAVPMAGSATMAVNNNGLPGGGMASNQDCGGTLIKSEVDKLKSALYPQQQMPFPPPSPLSVPQKSLHNQANAVQSQVGHQQQQFYNHQPEQSSAPPYLLHQAHNNGIDIDQQRQFVSTEDSSPPPPPPAISLPVDCFAMTNHQRHDEIQLLNQIQDTLKEGWTVHLAENGRLYYCK